MFFKSIILNDIHNIILKFDHTNSQGKDILRRILRRKLCNNFCLNM